MRGMGEKMLFEPTKHETLTSAKWNKDEVRKVIKSIYDDTLKSFDAKKYWIADANEDADIESNKTMYYGATGTLWALDKIAKYLDRHLPFNKVDLIDQIHEDYLREPDTKEVVPSLFLGEVGILLVQYKFNPSKKVEDKIFELVKANIENETLEALWGAPGTMIAASHMYRRTKDEHWSELFLENARYLIDKLKEEESKGELIWQQNMYGKELRYVGAGHGYFGNIYGIFKEIKFLSPEDRDYLLNHIKRVIKELSIEEDGMMNFEVLMPKLPQVKQLTQWCHGAPGVVTSLTKHPKDEFIDECLLKSGELIWQAGPLNKGVALCHGTDGNGYAFLQLYKRTHDEKWLERARSFAMHALGQRNGRSTLFTGELGLALYLIDCLEEGSDFPFLDSI